MRFKCESYIYSLREVLGEIVYSDETYFKNTSVHAFGFSDSFYNVIYNYIGSYIYRFPFVIENEGVYSIDSIVNDLIDRITARFADWDCVEVKEESELEKTSNKWLDKLINVILNTYSKYSTLLKFYNQEKDNLMKALVEKETIEADSSLESESRFNDTPQNSQGQTSFNDDEHSTNQGYAKNTGTSGAETTREKDSKYTIEKLDRINQLYRNLMLDWSNEFKILFIGGEYETH